MPPRAVHRRALVAAVLVTAAVGLFACASPAVAAVSSSPAAGARAPTTHRAWWERAGLRGRPVSAVEVDGGTLVVMERRSAAALP